MARNTTHAQPQAKSSGLDVKLYNLIDGCKWYVQQPKSQRYNVHVIILHLVPYGEHIQLTCLVYKYLLISCFEVKTNHTRTPID